MELIWNIQKRRRNMRQLLMLQPILDFSGLTLHICILLFFFWLSKANALTTTGIIFVALSVCVCVSRQQKACECIFIRGRTRAPCLLWCKNGLLRELRAGAHRICSVWPPFKSSITSALSASVWIMGRVAAAHKSFPFILSWRRRGRLCLGRARNGLSDEDEQQVLKPTSRGLSVLGREVRTQTGRRSGPSLWPPQIACHVWSFCRDVFRLLGIRLCGVGVLEGFMDLSGSPDLESNPLRLQSCW